MPDLKMPGPRPAELEKWVRENYPEIVKLLAKGLGSKAIASALDVSPKTIAYHAANILKKLSAKSRQETAIWALKYLSDDLE